MVDDPDTSDCTIPPAMTIAAISPFVLEQSAEDARDVIEYVEGQAADENVVHCEHVKAEHVLSDRYDVWDVHTDKGRWWVVTNPTNLYRQADFPSLDYTLSFHIGLMARVASRNAINSSNGNNDFAALDRKTSHIAEKLGQADEAEDFQNIGLLCREALVLLSRSLAETISASVRAEFKQADFKNWSDISANSLAPGSGAATTRSFLKHVAKEAWDHVSWLTHTSSATKYDAAVAFMATMTTIDAFVLILRKHRSGIPERCPNCRSYNLTSYYRPEFETESGYIKRCEKCEWADKSTTILDGGTF